MSGMDDLVTWLRAQLDDDERVAREATDGPWRVKEGEYGAAAVDGPDVLRTVPDPEAGGFRQVPCKLEVIPPDVDYGEVVDLADARHIVRHDPARVLAEVDAKRRILDRLVEDAAFDMPATKAQAASHDEWYRVVTARDVIKTLAMPYADRPGYRDEWRP